MYVFILVLYLNCSQTIDLFVVKYSLDGVVTISEIYKHSSECLGQMLVNI